MDQSSTSMKDVQVEIGKPGMEGGLNMFTNMPMHGTVVGRLSPDEMKHYWDMQDEWAAWSYAAPRDTDTMLQVKELSQLLRQFWMDFCSKNSIPFAWPTNVDYSTGYVYIDSK